MGDLWARPRTGIHYYIHILLAKLSYIWPYLNVRKVGKVIV